MKEETSILAKRQNNQRNIMLNLIWTNKDISKADLKNLSSYSITTVIGKVSELIDEGFVFEEDCSEARVGRKPIWLRINPKGGYFIGVEFNRNRMCCSVLNFRFEKIYFDYHTFEDNQKNADYIVELIVKMVGESINFLGEDSKKTIGIGIGTPGYIDNEAGIALSYNHFENWKNIQLKSIVEKEFAMPCYVGNNVEVMINAYKWLVYNGKCDDMIFISVRNGARCIPVINNKKVGSAVGYVGEIGHIRLRNSSRLCECGKLGCLNSEISDVAIINKIKEGMEIGRYKFIKDRYNVTANSDRLSTEMFREAVLANDEDAIELMTQCAKYLGEVLGTLLNIFAPKKVIIYGTYASLGEVFFEKLRKYTKVGSIEKNFSKVEIQPSVFGMELGAMGAALSVKEVEFFAGDENSDW